MKSHELDSLIDDCLEGRLSEADAAKLSRLIEESPETRARYWAAASVHGMLEQTIQQASLRVITGQETPVQGSIVRLFNWRPWPAAAAGLVLGLFCASVVWAYAVPLAKGTTERAVAIFSEGFEDAGLKTGRRFLKRPNEWFGDLSAPVGAVADVKPAEGRRMMPLIPEPKRRFSYARRIVDLAEHPEVAAAKALRLEVAASFNTAETARPSRYQIRLAAFSEAPAEVGAIWNNEPVLFDTVLQHVGRNVLTQPGEAGWQTVHASIQIPPGTRSIVISLAAGEADPGQPQGVHYVDDVQARFVITQTPIE